jgi:colicin import membrane protein
MQRNYASYFSFSFALHVFLVLALIVSLRFESLMPVMQNSDKNSEVINARVVGDLSPPMPVKKIMPTPPVMKSAPVNPQPPKPLQQTVVKKPQPVPVKQQAIVIPTKKAAKLRQDKIAQELLSDLKKQTQVTQKNHHKAVAAAFEKEMKRLAEKSLQQQLMQQQKAVAGARAQQVHGQVDKYKALILQVISSHWLLPPNVDKNLYAELLVRVAPGGVVLGVELTKSSGNDSLDRSARSAVLQSSPLPVPADSDAFEPFRQFVLKVRPKNMLTSDSWAS